MGYITYKMKDCSKEFLRNHKFRYNNYLSDYYDDKIYTYRFLLINCIECEIAISTISGIANINVYKSGTREKYVAYYNRQFGRWDTIKSIDVKINKKIKELGIEKI